MPRGYCINSAHTVIISCTFAASLNQLQSETFLKIVVIFYVAHSQIGQRACCKALNLKEDEQANIGMTVEGVEGVEGGDARCCFKCFHITIMEKDPR